MNTNFLSDIMDKLTGITDIVLDTGIIIEYLNEKPTQLQEWLNSNIFLDERQINLHSSEITHAELFYILCRKKSPEFARQTIENVQQYLTFHNELILTETAGRIKCAQSIALADCFTIATGIYLHCPILFKEESEMPNQTISDLKQKFGAKIIVFPKIDA